MNAQDSEPDIAEVRRAMSSDAWSIVYDIFGQHPIDWPRPPEKRPRWWQRKAVQRLKQLESVFGYLDDNALQRYWQEVRKGQSVYEDAGGYMIRCYEAMIGREIDEPTPYDSYLANILSEALNQSLTSAGKIG